MNENELRQWIMFCKFMVSRDSFTVSDLQISMKLDVARALGLIHEAIEFGMIRLDGVRYIVQ